MLRKLIVLWLGVMIACTARADYVGELETTKYFDDATITLIQSRLGAGQNLQVGDEISYFIQFTPTDNGGMVGGGGFVTDYIPAGTQVVGAQFVRLNGDGTYTQIAPPSPAAVLPYYVPFYSDTGIFYSTDPRTVVYTAPASPTITAGNGYATIGGGCKGISLPSTTHNSWDSAMVTAFAAAPRNKTGTCAVPPATTYNAATAINGLSPVAGPDAYLTKDSAGAAGPWQRIAYPGSYIGTRLGIASYGMTNACIGGVPTSAGYNLSSANPLPANTNAVRFAAGKVTVGELFSVRITLKLTTPMPVGGLVNNTEVFGGDASLDPGSAAGKDNHWKYHCPAVAVSNSNLLLVKTLVGACVGAGCVPTPVTAGVVPSAANLKLRYNIQYLNLGGTPQTNLVLKDTLATGAAYVAGSYAVLSGTGPGVPTGTTVLTFPTIPLLASGAGGKIQYDVNFAAAPATATALINTANLVSTQVPAPGVTSKAIATPTNLANLWISKSTSTPSVAPGNPVSYTIDIPNNGGAASTASAAKPITVNDFLPTSGTSMLAQDRFSYVAGSVLAQIVSSTGVITPVTPTVTVTPPATPGAREQITFNFTAGSITMGGRLTITYNATAGANVPASAMPYRSDVNVWYPGGPAGAAQSYSESIGTAPVTVTAPLTLNLKVDCVYAGATCVPFTNGTIAPGSKVRYRMDYKNVSASTLSGLTLTNTLPANTSYVAPSTQKDGSAFGDPSIAGQVLTFPALGSLAANATGYVTFDMQLGAGVTSGTDITDTAKLTASTFTAGVTASVTSSVRDQANLQISKTVTPSTINAGDTVTYTLTVTNIGNVSAKSIDLYDLLPYMTSSAMANQRFAFGAMDATTPFTTDDTGPNALVNVAPTTSVPPTFTGYGGQNRQQVRWTFGAIKALAPGKSFTLKYTATAGSAMVAGDYAGDAEVSFISDTVPPSGTMYASGHNLAPVKIGALNYLRIEHNGSGLTCTPETLTIKACTDATNCLPLFSGSVTADINGVGPVTFSGGQTTVQLARTTAGPFTLGTGAVSPAPQGATRCFNGATETCTLNFSDAAFILTNAAGGAEVTVPGQTAGVASSSYIVRAVKTDRTTGACTAGLTGAQTVNFGYECSDPASCAAGNLLSVNGVPVASNPNGGGLFGSYSYTGINLTFDANGNATTPLNFSYEDVGQITLRMQKTVNGANVLGNSNAFIVAPHHFDVMACTTGTSCTVANASPVDGTGAVFAAAADPFKATVRALSANNNPTPSFGTAMASVAGSETVNLTHAQTGSGLSPTSGTLTGTTAIPRSSFSNGEATITNLAYSEVGVLTLTADQTAFMGNAVSTSGSSGNIGRFVPAYFDTVVSGTMGCASGLTCPAGGMAYSGQVWSSVKVVAKNRSGSPTANYTGAFAKAVALSAVSGTTGATAAAGGTLGGTTTVPVASFGAGSATLSGNLPANSGAPAFTLSAMPGSPNDVYLRALDADNVDSSVLGTQGGLKLVSGRIKVGNGYGSNQLPLSLAAIAQYYDGTGWLQNAQDSVTTLSLPGTVAVGAGASTTGFQPASGTLQNGSQTIRLGKPTGGAGGQATIAPTVPGYLDLIQGQATFGIYKDRNDMIYRREAY